MPTPYTPPAASRRRFLRTAALGAAAFTIVPRHVLGRGFTAPSDQVTLGFIGLGKQGNILADFFVNETDARILAGSDVWDGKRSGFRQNVKRLYSERKTPTRYRQPVTYPDYRELLDRKDIDAVVVATPDHWHHRQTLDAIAAGKDVYCEKPLTNTILEGRAIVDAAERAKTVFQVGSMQRSWGRFQKAHEIVRAGLLGNVSKVLVNVGNPAGTYNLPAEVLPKGVDWGMWCGPGPLVEYNAIIAPAHANTYPAWRDYREFGSGRIGDWGAHMFDIAQWCLGKDDTGPVRYLPPASVPADTEKVRGLRMYYADGTEMVHEDFGRGWAVRFIGADGTLDVSRDFLETTPSTIRFSEAAEVPLEPPAAPLNHYEDWVSAIKTRGETICPAEVGHRSATIGNIGNIAYWLGRELRWDPAAEVFANDAEANALRGVEARAWGVRT